MFQHRTAHKACPMCCSDSAGNIPLLDRIKFYLGKLWGFNRKGIFDEANKKTF